MAKAFGEIEASGEAAALTRTATRSGALSWNACLSIDHNMDTRTLRDSKVHQLVE
jgi:hypothetical protein